MVFLRIIVDQPVRSVEEAVQVALDMGGEPVAVMSDDRVILDARQIREQAASLN